MPSEEMLKKLLDEFAEKEVLVQEELKVIYDQIGQLEQRLDLCRSRLSTIDGDRERVLQIRSRYSNGEFYTPQSFSDSSFARAETPVPPVVAEKVQPAKTEPRLAMPKVEPGAPTLSQPVPAIPEPVAAPPVIPEPVAPVLPEPVVPAEPTLPASGPQISVSTRRTQTGLNSILSARNEAIQWQQPTQIDLPTPQAQPVAQPQPATQPDPLAQPPAADPAYQTQEEWAATQAETPTTSQTIPALQNDTAPQDEQAQQNDGKIVDLESTEEGDSDTVKSINDALRSLFR